MQTISLRLPEDLVAALDRQAHDEGRDRSNMLRIMIQAYLASTAKPRCAVCATDRGLAWLGGVPLCMIHLEQVRSQMDAAQGRRPSAAEVVIRLQSAPK